VRGIVYKALGAIIYAAIRGVAVLQTALGTQPRQRSLTPRERDVLEPIFGDAIDLDAVEIVDGRAGLLGISGRAFAMGFVVYLPHYSEEILVHELTHVWQFQTDGLGYVGNSALHQLAGLLSMKRYHPYHWRRAIDAGTTWQALASVEAQAQFIQDLYREGEGQAGSERAPGAFFRSDTPGANRFCQGDRDYTTVANDAWRNLRDG
jgi:hypothetical protein